VSFATGEAADWYRCATWRSCLKNVFRQAAPVTSELKRAKTQETAADIRRVGIIVYSTTPAFLYATGVTTNFTASFAVTVAVAVAAFVTVAVAAFVAVVVDVVAVAAVLAAVAARCVMASQPSSLE
jgi:hypothetical protein